MISAMVDDCGSFILELRKAWPADAMTFLVSVSNCLAVATRSIIAIVDFVTALSAACSYSIMASRASMVVRMLL